jgi:hypothetical protein
MADWQVPWGVDALHGAVTRPAWRDLSSWYLLTTEDRMMNRLVLRQQDGPDLFNECPISTLR